ncbi:acyl-CoA synthetase (AMP-forming)/AMP-acid ligase II [Pseudonocardia sediminis]|uniref:Acyl-CoA synthetase (AMP-forming)/AMP-acid ligase II n=1 Tax=Pseudonocardia sediminis TaxID=1397368 RepID=A0A4Q7UXP6_PSEST|nr:class I adenylate-forming enzyme family protein [Pseudonocardia sediminis]RZT86555.1 acyl-CoA synthetase (AMP-forming)/AMP-acid ligase II [Pseudonocardia sediminis]
MGEHADEVGLGPVIAGLTAPGGEFELATEQVDGRPMRVYRRGPHTLRELVVGTEVFGDATFTVYRGERRTYREHLTLVAGLARALLHDHALTPGDRVAIAMRNLPEWPVVFFAAQVAGLVAVPLNAWWSGSELAWAVEDSGSRMVVADTERTDLLAAEGVPADGVAVVRVRGDGPAPEGVREWADVVEGLDPAATVPEARVGPDDVATILYTSGTTGRPKGAVGTHRNHCTNLLNVALQGRAGSLLAGTTPSTEPGTLLAYPMFHIAGINGLVGAVLGGAKLATLHHWDPDTARELVRDERLTRTAGVPSTMAALVDQAAEHPADLASLTTIGMGGAPIPPELVTRIGRDLGAGAANGYGLTETTSAICANSGPDYQAHPDSVGRPAPGAELRIATADGEGPDAAEGEIGELWFRGPNIVRGYWNNPDADAAAFVDGWFRTGDLGLVRDGWVYVVDRLKDVVLRGGENVYSAQVESAIHDVPGVVEVAVLGVPHPTLGEEVAAIVHAEPGAARDDDAIRAAVTARVGAFAAPAHVHWSDEPLPRTATGKIRKRDLRTTLPGPA